MRACWSKSRNDAQRAVGGAVNRERPSWKVALLAAQDLAPRHGFEPRFTAPKAAVLPLDDRGRDWKQNASLQSSVLSSLDATMLESTLEASLGRCCALSSKPPC